MKLFVFAVYDGASGMYGTPMFLMSPGQAIRSFSDEVNRAEKDNVIYMHPDDFDLYKLGEFDTSVGLFECAIPERVAIGKNVKIRSE